MPLLVGTAAFALGRRRERSTFDMILLAVTSFLALRARRDVWFAVLAAVAVLSGGGGAHRASYDRMPLDRRRLAVFAAGISAVLAIATGLLCLSRKHLEARIAECYPVQAATVVEERKCPAPLFNEYGWGSFLIWRLPFLPVSIDGRADLHGPERIRRNIDT